MKLCNYTGTAYVGNPCPLQLGHKGDHTHPPKPQVAAAPALPDAVEEAISELKNLALDLDYRADSFTLQPLRIALQSQQKAALPEVAPTGTVALNDALSLADEVIELRAQLAAAKGGRIDCKRCGGKGEVENWETTPGGIRISVTDDCPACSRLRWIDCKQELPPMNETVLFWNTNNYPETGSYREYIKGLPSFRSYSGTWINATYWMRPTPPDNKGEGQ